MNFVGGVSLQVTMFVLDKWFVRISDEPWVVSRAKSVGRLSWIFFCFLGFSMVERCEWENQRFFENNFHMACCCEKRTGNGIEIIVGRYRVCCFVWFYVDELTRTSRMKWIDWVVLLVFAANERLFVIFTELFVGEQAGAVRVNNEDKIEVFSIVRLVELTVSRKS